MELFFSKFLSGVNRILSSNDIFVEGIGESQLFLLLLFLIEWTQVEHICIISTVINISQWPLLLPVGNLFLQEILLIDFIGDNGNFPIQIEIVTFKMVRVLKLDWVYSEEATH